MVDKQLAKTLSIISLVGVILSVICIFAGLLAGSAVVTVLSVIVAAAGTACAVIGNKLGQEFVHKMIMIMSIIWLVAAAFTVATLWMLAH